MEKYKKIVSKINFGAFLMLLASLPYPLPFIQFCWYVWIVTWLLEFRYIARTPLKRHSGMVYLSGGILLWMIWNILSLFWAAHTQIALNTIVRYASMLTIPFICLFGCNEYYDWRKCIKVLLISGLISIGVYMFTHYWVINFHYALNKHATDKIVHIDWLNMNDLLLNIKHRMHFTNLLCMLIPCLVILHSKIGKLRTIVAAAILLCAIYMTGSRMAMVNVVVVATVTCCWFILRKQKAWVKYTGVGLAIVVILLGSVGGMLLHPRNAGHSVSELISVNEERIEKPAFEPRFAIWQTALEQRDDYILYGLGAGNATKYLVKCYQENDWKQYASRQFSPHCQYLGVCMDLGIVAAILFIIFWIGIPFFFTGTQRYWVLCATGISMCSMMTDMLLGGLEGIVFVAIMAVLGYLLPSNAPISDSVQHVE